MATRHLQRIHYIYFLIIYIITPVRGCRNGHMTFEMVTGFVYTAPTDTLEVLPGTLQLTECMNYCKRNETCQSINFETGLCVLFSSSAVSSTESLTPSQFPVFTIYAHKICLTGRRQCSRELTFERVMGHELRDVARKTERVDSRVSCISACMNEIEFVCRSANYYNSTGMCDMSDVDRTSLPASRKFVEAANPTDVDYLENNCVDDDVKLCEFRKIPGKKLKTVDAVYQDVQTFEECRQKCLNVNYRCQSFDYGDSSNNICRLSHHSTATLTHIQEPYLEIPGSVTFEKAACYNVTIHCGSREMTAFVKTSKVFNGKVYAKSRPNSCVSDVANSLSFEIKMAYHDLNCDVKQESFGEYSNDIVIQHHDMVVTTQDLGLSVHCQYDLSNRSVSNGVQLEVNGDVDTTGSQSATVTSPNVTMRITDRQGNDVLTAQVGEPLALRFEIIDSHSPFEIFVRELVAMDGVDNSEILLIDNDGCPTDTTIMGPLSKVNSNGQILQAPFDAFKFPTSDIVQFKALVTPCLPNCQPAKCTVRNFGLSRELDSFGRKRRRRSTDEELVVVQSIQITDKFGFERNERKLTDFDSKQENSYPDEIVTEDKNEGCINTIGLVVSCTCFLLAQFALILAWIVLWTRKKNKTSTDIDMLYGIKNPYQMRMVHH
ncbi:uncharacterized protein [Centruroides vittatus]|uniref:uncharacterized protein isoform X2 n=1 Tax=Centruroides vittatus TaxID=120091 RepID=UPI003510A88D